VAGIVLGLQITTPGAVLRPAEPVLHIVPQDRPLIVAARIPPIHIDEVRAGQSAELVLTALASRDRPRLTGRVVRVSADALADPQTGAAYYLAEIAPDPRANPDLRPGMPVEVYLLTGTRTPLAYLTAPFAAYFQRAFRES
jgi:HlyD family secretion protein